MCPGAPVSMAWSPPHGAPGRGGAKRKEIKVRHMALKGLLGQCPLLSLLLGCCEVSSLLVAGFHFTDQAQGNGARCRRPQTFEALSQNQPFQLIASGISSQDGRPTQHTADCQQPGAGGQRQVPPLEFQEKRSPADTLTPKPSLYNCEKIDLCLGTPTESH